MRRAWVWAVVGMAAVVVLIVGPPTAEIALVCRAVAVVVWFGAVWFGLGTLESRDRDKGRFRHVYTGTTKDGQVTVLVVGGDYEYERTVGKFDPDETDAITRAVVAAQKGAEEYRERVEAAERLSATLNKALKS